MNIITVFEVEKWITRSYTTRLNTDLLALFTHVLTAKRTFVKELKILPMENNEDKTINGVSQNVALIIKDWESDNETNQGCWNCTRCTGCVDCIDCYDCHDCTDCTTCSHSSSCNNCNSVQSCVGCVGLSQTSNRQFEVL